MTIQKYLGSAVKIRADFTVESTATDPATVVAKWRDPSQAITTYTYGTNAEVSKRAKGVYLFQVTPTVLGVYRLQVTGTNPDIVQIIDVEIIAGV